MIDNYGNSQKFSYKKSEKFIKIYNNFFKKNNINYYDFNLFYLDFIFCDDLKNIDNIFGTVIINHNKLNVKKIIYNYFDKNCIDIITILLSDIEYYENSYELKNFEIIHFNKNSKKITYFNKISDDLLNLIYNTDGGTIELKFLDNICDDILSSIKCQIRIKCPGRDLCTKEDYDAISDSNLEKEMSRILENN